MYVYVGYVDNKLISYRSGCICVGYIVIIVLYVNMYMYI